MIFKEKELISKELIVIIPNLNDFKITHFINELRRFLLQNQNFCNHTVTLKQVVVLDSGNKNFQIIDTLTSSEMNDFEYLGLALIMLEHLITYEIGIMPNVLEDSYSLIKSVEIFLIINVLHTSCLYVFRLRYVLVLKIIFYKLIQETGYLDYLEQINEMAKRGLYNDPKLVL